MRAAVLAAAAALACAAPPGPGRANPGASVSVIEPKDRLEAVGVGAPDPILPSVTQRKASAREAAMTRARYELLSAMRALVLKSGITLEQAGGLDPALEERLRQAASAAQYATEFTPDDGCVVRLLLSKRKLGEDLGVRFR